MGIKFVQLKNDKYVFINEDNTTITKPLDIVQAQNIALKKGLSKYALFEAIYHFHQHDCNYTDFGVTGEFMLAQKIRY